MRWLWLAMLFEITVTGTATAQAPGADAPDVALHVRSTGRAVKVEVLDVEPRVACVTPCTLQVPGGSHRARVDGLDRTIVAGDEPVVVRPIRRGQFALAIALVVLGGTGLTLAGHWASPLDDRQRVIGGLGGVAMLGVAVPLLFSSTARVGGPRLEAIQPGQVEVLTTVQQFVRAPADLATAPLVGAGLGYRLENRRLGARALARFATDGSGAYQVTAGPTFHAPKLPIVQPTLAINAGVSSHRELDHARALDLPAAMVSSTLHAVVELDVNLRIDLPGVFQPNLGVTAQVYPGSGSWGVLGVAGVLARL